MEARKVIEAIKAKRKSACDQMYSEAKRGHARKYYELKGEIDAYTDAIALIRFMEEKENDNKTMC